MFLRFLTLPEMYVLKDMTIWIHNLLKDKNTVTQCHDEKNNCPGFLLFLGLSGIPLHRRQGKLPPECWICEAEQFSLALCLAVLGTVMQCYRFGEGLVFRDQQLSGP